MTSRRVWAHATANQEMLRDDGGGRAVEFLRQGGMRSVEEKAAAAAIADARDIWLPQLERWHARAKGTARSLLAGEIKRCGDEVAQALAGRGSRRAAGRTQGFRRLRPHPGRECLLIKLFCGRRNGVAPRAVKQTTARGTVIHLINAPCDNW